MANVPSTSHRGARRQIDRFRPGLVAAFIVLAVALLLVPASRALAPPVFTDVPSNHPYATAIADLAAREI